MLEWFGELSPVVQALLATLFTWAVTAVGAGAVFFTRTVNQKLLDTALGFAAGVMIAASYWSLLAPAIEMAEGGALPAWLPAVAGFIFGGIFLWGMDKLLPHLHIINQTQQAEGLQTNWHRTVLFILAVTLHNIPEGLAVGVAFGAAAQGVPSATIAGALALALGIGIQNMPEGTAISMPLRGAGVSKWRSFFYGQLSAVVEPIAGVLGVLAVTVAKPILPYALSFAAGAMIFVVVEELIPTSHSNDNHDLATMGAMFGFSTMMFLDVALG
jgi:ZIP family zinc transporter